MANFKPIKKTILIALNKHHLSKAIHLSQNSQSKIFYVGNEQSIFTASNKNIENVTCIDHLGRIKIVEPINCFVFSMQPHPEFIKLFINIRNHGGLIIHLEETHQLQMHEGLISTFQLVPDAILLSSECESKKYKELFPNNLPLLLRAGWNFQNTFRHQQPSKLKKSNQEILIFFSAPKILTLASSEDFISRLNLILWIKGSWDIKEIVLKLHPSENKSQFKNFLVKNNFNNFRILESDVSEIDFEKYKVISSDKSQITMDLIQNNINFFIYCFGMQNFISKSFTNNCICDEGGMKIYEVKSYQQSYQKFKEENFFLSYQGISDLEEDLNQSSIKPNLDSHKTNIMIINYFKNKNFFKNEMRVSASINELSINIFSKDYNLLRSDQSYLIDCITFDNIQYLYNSSRGFRIDDSNIVLANAFFSPLKFLRAFNFLIYKFSFDSVVSDFPKLTKIQANYAEKSLLFYTVQKLQSASKKTRPIIAFCIFHLIDLPYKILDKIKRYNFFNIIS